MTKRCSAGAVSRALALACAVMAGCVSAAELPVVKACGHHDYPPWNWERGQQIVGACAAVARRAIERLGYRVDLSFVGPWKRCQAMVASGEVDVNICSFRNAEREAYSVFAEPRMAQNRIAVFVNKPHARRSAASRGGATSRACAPGWCWVSAWARSSTASSNRTPGSSGWSTSGRR